MHHVSCVVMGALNPIIIFSLHAHTLELYGMIFWRGTRLIEALYCGMKLWIGSLCILRGRGSENLSLNFLSPQQCIMFGLNEMGEFSCRYSRIRLLFPPLCAIQFDMLCSQGGMWSLAKIIELFATFEMCLMGCLSLVISNYLAHSDFGCFLPCLLLDIACLVVCFVSVSTWSCLTS